MTHPPPGKYVSIAANQRVKREDEKAASPDPLPSACSCLLSEHCDSRPGCRLRAGATINQGGGICGPYAQSRAGPLPSDKAVEAAIRHRLTSDGCCPYCLPHGTIEEGPPGATWTVECEHGGIKQTARRYLTAAYAVDMPRLVAERDDLWHKLGETMARANTLEIERDQLRGREAEVRAATLREVVAWLRAQAERAAPEPRGHLRMAAAGIEAHFNQEAE